MTDEKKALDDLAEAKADVEERLTGVRPSRNRELGPPGQGQRREVRPYEPAELADVPPGRGLVGSVSQTLELEAASTRRSEEAGQEAQREREEAQRKNTALVRRQQALQRAEDDAARVKGDLERTRSELEARLAEQADSFREARGNLPTGDTQALLKAIVALRAQLETAATTARQLEGLEIDVNRATVQHQAAAWKRDHPDDPQDGMWETRIAYADAGKTAPRRAVDFYHGVGLPDPDAPTLEVAGAEAANALADLAREQRELAAVLPK